MKTKPEKLKTIISLISQAENGMRLPKRQFTNLVRERIKLCKELTDRLFEINRAINFASNNAEYMLPYAEYKNLNIERKIIRMVLKEANWDIYSYNPDKYK